MSWLGSSACVRSLPSNHAVGRIEMLGKLLRGSATNVFSQWGE